VGCVAAGVRRCLDAVVGSAALSDGPNHRHAFVAQASWSPARARAARTRPQETRACQVRTRPPSGGREGREGGHFGPSRKLTPHPAPFPRFRARAPRARHPSPPPCVQAPPRNARAARESPPNPRTASPGHTRPQANTAIHAEEAAPNPSDLRGGQEPPGQAGWTRRMREGQHVSRRLGGERILGTLMGTCTPGPTTVA
jgi:hypothetical protein